MEIKDGRFYLNGSPFFLYSGEVHYFRIPKAEWPRRLKALKAAGFNAVSTYIPWIWHEPEEGRLDFAGETLPERDVLGFIEAARREKLHVCARLGPVSNAELVHEGLPAWLLRDYPDVFVTGRRANGYLSHVTMISYMHPTFQEKVGRWYDALLPLISKRQAARGGPVISVQLCNEVAMVHWLQKGADHKDHVNRMFRDFVKEKYGDIRKLNQAYRTVYASFEEVKQPTGDGVDVERLDIHMDWSLFYRRYYAAYFQTLSRRALAAGIEVPLFCNIPQFYDYDIRGRGNMALMTTSQFRDFPLFTPDVVFGGAYQMRHLDFENFHDVALTTEITRMLGALRVTKPAAAGNGHLPAAPEFEPLAASRVPTVCAELQTGIMRDRPRLYPQQVSLNVKSSVAHGLAGVNAYMFAGGKNPLGLGAFGSYHDWQSPLGSKGEARPHLAPLKDFGRFLKWAGPLLAQTEKVTDTGLGFYLPYYASEYWEGPWAERLAAQRDSLWYDGMARLVQLAGFSYSYADLERSSLEVLRQFPSLWVYSLDFMDGNTQKKLAEYVRQGGRLILGPRLPSRNLRGDKETALADALGIAFAEALPGNCFRREEEDFWVQGPIQVFTTEQKAKNLIEVPGGAAVIQAHAGRGQALVIGFGLPHVFDHYRDWLRGWAEGMGLTPAVEAEPWEVQAVLRQNKEFGFLFLFNYHFTDREAAVRLTPAQGPSRLPAAGRLALGPLSGAILPLRIPLGPGRRLDYATAEVLDLSADAKGAKLVFASPAGKAFEAVFELGKKPAAVQGGKLSWKGGKARVALTPAGPETGLRLDF